jgi:ectoine hydroxylase-related dioxygenase (phytanoyl-CoA dioxygenase family)
MHIPDFTLGESITREQREFLDEHGFIRFAGVASQAEVDGLRTGMAEIEAAWLAEGRTHVCGIPVKYGRRADGTRYVNRFAFASRHSERFRRFLADPRLDAVRRLVAEDARIGHDEKDGVVVNAFVNEPGSRYSRLGWHTDGLRDLFYLHLPKPMLNVGLYLDDCPPEKGGVRILPGTHRQGLLAMLLRKLHFLDNRPDPREVALQARAGDLTLHDGRLWHRTAQATLTGAASLRRTMYVPFVTGPRVPKTEASPTPLYHYLQGLVG